jgi:molybdate transport system substrate-binding protein
MRRLCTAAILTALTLAGGSVAIAEEAELHVLAAGSVAAAFKILLIDFARETGNKVEVSFGPVGALQARLKKGESPDVIVLTAAAMEEMEKAGSLAAGSRAELGRGTAGIAVRSGAPSPDIATPEKVKQAFVAARSLAYPNPAGGGTAGVWFVNLMERLGIADEVKKKAQPMNRGFEIAGAVGDGTAEIGVTFISELLPNKELKVVGPFPESIGLIVPYVAGVSSASRQSRASRALISYLTRPSSRAIFKATGL